MKKLFILLSVFTIILAGCSQKANQDLAKSTAAAINSARVLVQTTVANLQNVTSVEDAQKVITDAQAGLSTVAKDLQDVASKALAASATMYQPIIDAFNVFLTSMKSVATDVTNYLATATEIPQKWGEVIYDSAKGLLSSVQPLLDQIYTLTTNAGKALGKMATTWANNGITLINAVTGAKIAPLPVPQ